MNSEDRDLHAPAPPVLVVGHPGHELRVYGWLMRTRPVVHVLTDGSGSSSNPRIASTGALLDKVFASRGSVFGRLSDRDVYSAILTGDHALFIALADEIAGTLVERDAQLVAGDALEGFNPSHDVCRYIINAAVRLASRTCRRRIACFAFPLDAAPDLRPDGVDGDALRVELDDATLELKLRAARDYVELHSEIESALDRFGAEPFRSEYLWPIDLGDPYGWDPRRIPFYESHGSWRVAAGVYDRVVTFRDHVRPLADALWCHSVLAG